MKLFCFFIGDKIVLCTFYLQSKLIFSYHSLKIYLKYFYIPISYLFSLSLCTLYYECHLNSSMLKMKSKYVLSFLIFLSVLINNRQVWRVSRVTKRAEQPLDHLQLHFYIPPPCFFFTRPFLVFKLIHSY